MTDTVCIFETDKSKSNISTETRSFSDGETLSVQLLSGQRRFIEHYWKFMVSLKHLMSMFRLKLMKLIVAMQSKQMFPNSGFSGLSGLDGIYKKFQYVISWTLKGERSLVLSYKVISNSMLFIQIIYSKSIIHFFFYRVEMV